MTEQLIASGKDAWRSISEFHQIVPPGEKLQICSFLWVYYGFPTSAYEGINVDEVRFRNGMLVGKEDRAEVDAVCSIPDSGTGMAMGYAVGKGFRIGRRLPNIHRPGPEVLRLRTQSVEN